MTYIDAQNRISYDAQLREMDADELITEYYKLITQGNIVDNHKTLDLIRRQYKQLTGTDIQDIISKTA